MILAAIALQTIVVVAAILCAWHENHKLLRQIEELIELLWQSGQARKGGE